MSEKCSICKKYPYSSMDDIKADLHHITRESFMFFDIYFLCTDSVSNFFYIYFDIKVSRF